MAETLSDDDPPKVVRRFHEIKDAYYHVRPIEFVPPGPPLEYSLFDDDPEYRAQLWRLTLASLKAPIDPKTEQDIIEAARRVAARINAESPNGGAPRDQTEAERNGTLVRAHRSGRLSWLLGKSGKTTLKE